MERKLTAILAADVVGYSRLMESDEAGTLTRLKAHRAELINPAISAHHGRLVKLMGDGALVEFASVVDAVQCAIHIQRRMAELNAGVPEDRRLALRIGVTLGDVIVEGDDIYGDGVNVAARLQGLAQPGSISISGTAFDQVEGKLDCGYEFLGAQQVKNIAKPVRIYRVVMEAGAAGKIVASRRRLAPRWQWGIAAALVLAVAGGGTAGWLRPWEPAIELAAVEGMVLPLPDKPSLAVLPFANMSGDREQDYFVDGMTDDLITDLSKLSGLFVIARNSVFAFKGRNVNIREVAETLGVRYVLEGSARRAGNQVRVNAQLIDATTGGHLWAERYDGSVESIFEVQDRFVRAIVEALALNLSKTEQDQIGRGQTNNLDAREAFQRGWEHYQRYTPEDNARAAAEFLEAVELDSNYGRAYAALGLVYYRGCSWQWYKALGTNEAEAVNMSYRYLEEAKARRSSLAYVAGSHIYLYSGRHGEALTEAVRAIALDPNDPEAHLGMAWVMIATGKAQAALEFVETAMRLNPGYPRHYVLARGLALFAMNELDEAARAFEEVVQADADAADLAAPLAATYARLGRRQDARETLLKGKPGANQSELELAAANYDFPFKWSSDGQKVEERFRDGLYVAALPLEITVSGLIGALENGSIFERRRTIRNIGQFGPQASESVPALIKALGVEQHQAVRSEAIIALRKIGAAAREAIPALKAIRGDEWLLSQAKDAVAEIASQ